MYDPDVIASQKGDQAAFSRLIESNQQSMYRVAYAILQNDSDALDAIQEAIIKAYVGIPRLKRLELFKTWLIRILINECIYLLRQRKKVIPIDITVTNGKTRTEPDIDTQLTVRFALRSLDEQLQIIVVLFYYENLSIKEIARLLNVPEGTVKSRLNRARSHLAAIISNNEERGASCGRQ